MSPSILQCSLVALTLSVSTAWGTDYSRTLTTSSANWSDSAQWTPEGVPNNTSDNVEISLTSTSSLQIDGSYGINDLFVDGNGGTTLYLRALNVNGDYSLNLTGTLSKSNNSSSIAIADNSGSQQNLDVTINRLDLATNGGSVSFGRADGGRVLNSLDMNEVVMGGAGGNNDINIYLNVSTDYRLGEVTFNTGDNEKSVYLITNGSSDAGYTRAATVNGISDNSNNATIYGSIRASTSTNNASLLINAGSGSSYTANTLLSDGTGGILSVTKTGAGTQALTNDQTYTGDTLVEEGVLIISGTLSSTGSVQVSEDATFVAANALTIQNLNVEAGAILGFDLEAGGEISVSGNLEQIDAGANGFLVDFMGTGTVDQAYEGILTVAGTSTYDESDEISYVNFGSTGRSGTLTYGELVNGFTIPAIPEQSTLSLLVLCMVFAMARCRKRAH